MARWPSSSSQGRLGSESCTWAAPAGACASKARRTLPFTPARSSSLGLSRSALRGLRAYSEGTRPPEATHSLRRREKGGGAGL